MIMINCVFLSRLTERESDEGQGEKDRGAR